MKKTSKFATLVFIFFLMIGESFADVSLSLTITGEPLTPPEEEELTPVSMGGGVILIKQKRETVKTPSEELMDTIVETIKKPQEPEASQEPETEPEAESEAPQEPEAKPKQKTQKPSEYIYIQPTVKEEEYGEGYVLAEITDSKTGESIFVQTQKTEDGWQYEIPQKMQEAETISKIWFFPIGKEAISTVIEGASEEEEKEEEPQKAFYLDGKIINEDGKITVGDDLRTMFVITPLLNKQNQDFKYKIYYRIYNKSGNLIQEMTEKSVPKLSNEMVSFYKEFPITEENGLSGEYKMTVSIEGKEFQTEKSFSFFVEEAKKDIINENAELQKRISIGVSGGVLILLSILAVMLITRFKFIH